MKLERCLRNLMLLESGAAQGVLPSCIDVRARCVVTLSYACVVLTVPLTQIVWLLALGGVPWWWCRRAGVPYVRLLRQAVWVLPFIVAVGAFHPFYYTQPYGVAGVEWCSVGWVMFVSLMVRGLLCVQAFWLLVLTTGFRPLCLSLQRCGVPSLFTTQLLLVYRFMGLVLQQALHFRQAVQLRSGGEHLTLRVWCSVTGHLLMVCMLRSERVYAAMVVRGFNGGFRPLGSSSLWRWCDTRYVAQWGVVFGLFTVARYLWPVICGSIN